MRHDLFRLGATEFEALTQALAIQVLGSAVQVFGSGPDGGREATFRSRANHPDPAPAEGPGGRLIPRDFEPNSAGRYSAYSITGTPSPDGSITVRFVTFRTGPRTP